MEAALDGGGDVEELCRRLEAAGVGGMVVEDEADFRTFLRDNRQYWDYVDEELEKRFAGVSRVKFYLPDDGEGHALLERLREKGFSPALSFIADEDWENGWKQYYRPLPIGCRLVVVPAWEENPDDGRVPLRLDPGLIFGTGSHATTRMCLCELETLAGPGRRVLDLGCGSGILSIAALNLGCSFAAGCDVDPKAPDVALGNAGLNGIGKERFAVYAGDVLQDAALRNRLGGGYDIVLANIVADVILPLAGMVRAFMAPGAAFVCSGVLHNRRAEVEQALRSAGLTVTGHRCEEDWHCFSCR
jgi:ribosomal protein L11 methyltransferase